VKKILVPLVNVAGSTASAQVDRVNNDVKDGLPQKSGSLAFRKQHGQIQE